MFFYPLIFHPLRMHAQEDQLVADLNLLKMNWDTFVRNANRETHQLYRSTP